MTTDYARKSSSSLQRPPGRPSLTCLSRRATLSRGLPGKHLLNLRNHWIYIQSCDMLVADKRVQHYSGRRNVSEHGQLELFSKGASVSLPDRYVPVPAQGFEVERILLGKGSIDTAQREAFVRRICSAYPDVPVEEHLDSSAGAVDLEETNPLRRQLKGKRTLVFGQLQARSAVRCTRVADKEYSYRWHFSVYGYCFYRCAYCYLAGTNGVWHSPTVKIYVNLPEIVTAIERHANRLDTPTFFCLGKLQDGLALDPLTAYSRVLIPFFAEHPHARLLIQTKSADVERLLNLEHGGHTTLSWSLNPPEVVRCYESHVPSTEDRIAAMERCAAHGYPVQGLIQPFIPVGDWETTYDSFVRELMDRVPLQELSIAGACMGLRTLSLLERRMGRENAISTHLASSTPTGQVGTYYRTAIEQRFLVRIAEMVRRRKPGWIVTMGRQHPSALRVLRMGPRTC